jgi:hypothetical protein
MSRPVLSLHSSSCRASSASEPDLWCDIVLEKNTGGCYVLHARWLQGQFCWWNHSGEPTQPTAAALARGGMGLPAGLKTREDGRVSLDSIDEEYAKSALPSPVSVASSTNSSSSSSASASSTS